MTRTTPHTTTIQLWPGGHSYTFRGDPNGPPNQRSLQDPNMRTTWRKGTDAEWRAIQIAQTAEHFLRNDVLCCDSSLIDELIKLEHTTAGPQDLARAFSYDEIENLYPDASSWDAETCRDWIREHCEGEQPTRPVVAVDPEDGTVPHAAGCATHTVPAAECTCGKADGTLEVLDPDADTDDGRHGYLTELRQVVADHAEAAEVFEWWRVSSWLCDQLRAAGYVVLDNGYGHWWGRTCTGQAVIMDGTLQTVAARLVKETA